MFLTLDILAAGYCTQSAALLFRGEAHRTVQFPALCAVIHHPVRGPILFDTGYALRWQAATTNWPYRFLRLMTPVFVEAEESIAWQLRHRNIDPADVKTIILSHFHSDHLGGLHDFPTARFIFLDEAYAAVRGRQELAAVQQAYLPQLLPPDFETRADAVSLSQTVAFDPTLAPFSDGIDLLGDGSLWAVHLPGHAPGQIGLICRANNDEIYFLAADACWHSRAYREHHLPHPAARMVTANWTAYVHTLGRLHQFHRHRPEVHLIPSHCSEARDRYVNPAT